MWEFFVVIISFINIPLLNKKNMPIGISICICAFTMALLGGLSLLDIKEILSSTFFDMIKVQRYIIILEIGILGALLEKYRILDEVINYTVKVIKNKKIVLMALPALVGLLSIPGGAIISAPFVDNLGDGLGLSNNEKAIVNLVFRHFVMYILPYSASILLVNSLVPQISVYKLIGINSTFAIPYAIIGYTLYLKKLENNKIISADPVLPSLLYLLIYTSPVYLAVILNLLLNIPFYIGMIANLLVIFLLRPNNNFLSDSVQALNMRVLIVFIGVYLIQGVIAKMESISSILSLIFSNPQTLILGIISTSFFFSVITGLDLTALGVVLPILITLPLSENRLLLFCHFTLVWSFMGYFFSPLHLCQLFTCEYMKVYTINLYKDYWKFFLYLIVVLIVSYFILSLLIK